MREIEGIYTYQIIATEKEFENKGKITVYGLCVSSYCNKNLEKKSEVCVEDISSEFDKVRELQMLMEKNKVSLIHVRDMIEHYIAV